MFISSSDVVRLREVRMLTAEIGKVVRKLEAERDELEGRLIKAAKAGQKVEAACPYRLQLAAEDKTYRPPYKECAIELNGEKAVTDWVIKNDPHATRDVLSLVAKKAEGEKVSKTTTLAINAAKGAVAAKVA